MNILEIKNVTKDYAKHRALNDVSISIPKGSIYGLLGPNGAGKTSLIRIINQITGPDTGVAIDTPVPDPGFGSWDYCCGRRAGNHPVRPVPAGSSGDSTADVRHPVLRFRGNL